VGCVARSGSRAARRAARGWGRTLIVVFDASVLVYLFDEKASAPQDPTTGQAVADCKMRIDHLIATLEHSQTKIIIPTPALAKCWSRPTGLHLSGRSYSRNRVIFASHLSTSARPSNMRPCRPNARRLGRSHWRRVVPRAKFDDQIVAIAAVEGATVIYSDDPDIGWTLSPSSRRAPGMNCLGRKSRDPGIELSVTTRFGADIVEVQRRRITAWLRCSKSP
jgi:hypothetical protein